MATVSIILMVLAFVAFLVAAAGINYPKVGFVALGLALWVLAQILTGVKL